MLHGSKASAWTPSSLSLLPEVLVTVVLLVSVVLLLVLLLVTDVMVIVVLLLSEVLVTVLLLLSVVLVIVVPPGRRCRRRPCASRGATFAWRRDP